MEPEFRNIPKVPGNISVKNDSRSVLTEKDKPAVKENIMRTFRSYFLSRLDEPDLYFFFSHLEPGLLHEFGVGVYNAEKQVIKPALESLVEEGRVERSSIFVVNNNRRQIYRLSPASIQIFRYDTSFEEKLKEVGVPGEHSIFIMVDPKYGYNLMELEESTRFVGEGKRTEWFYTELKRRYEERRKSIYSSI